MFYVFAIRPWVFYFTFLRDEVDGLCFHFRSFFKGNKIILDHKS